MTDAAKKACEVEGYPQRYTGRQEFPTPHRERRFLRSPQESVRLQLDEFFRRHPTVDLI